MRSYPSAQPTLNCENTDALTKSRVVTCSVHGDCAFSTRNRTYGVIPSARFTISCEKTPYNTLFIFGVANFIKSSTYYID